MLRFEFQGMFQIGVPLFWGLVRQSVNQIDSDIVKSAFSGPVQGRGCILSGMYPAQEFKIVIPEGLESNTPA